MFERLRERWSKAYVEALIAREKRIQRKQERDKKKMMSLRQGTIRYGLGMKQNPLELMHDVYDVRQQKRKQKEDEG